MLALIRNIAKIIREFEENNNEWIAHNTKFYAEGKHIGLDIYPEDIHIMRKVNDNE